MKRLVLYPYLFGSSSVRKIKKVLGGIRVFPDGKYKPKANDVIINWGSNKVPSWKKDDRPILNSPEKVKIATNKLLCFQVLKGKVAIPDFTTSKEEAKSWEDIVVVRHLLRSNSGKGIELVKEGELPNAPLYVRYKKKRKEFRVHVFKDKVIGVVEKRKPKLENRPVDFDTYIRSHTNGWIFCLNDVIEPDGLREIAIQAVKTLELDFGAVDIIWNEAENQCYVLEVNTAPGIEGTTLTNYCNEIKECLV